MTAYLKPLLFTGLGVCCLVIGADAQTPAPAAQPTPVPPRATAPAFPGQSVPLTATAHGTYTTLQGAGGFYYGEAFDGEARNLAKAVAAAKGDGDIEKAKDKLKDHLDKQFEARQKRHEDEVKALEEQVKRLKDMIGKRKDNKREIIDERTKQLIRDAQGLGW
jgi:hypothetical protein